MEIPGIAPLSGQPTLTNPLSKESLLEGRQTSAQQASEVKNTVTSSEKHSTTVNTAEVVDQANEVDATGFDDNIGQTIDLTA